MAHNLADHRAIAKSVMSHGQVTTGYPILKNSFTPSMAGVEFDQQPVAIDRSPKIADGLTASKKRRISEADSSTSQQSNKLMPNRHTENVMEFGLTKGTLLTNFLLKTDSQSYQLTKNIAFDLAFWEELDQWIENARSSLPHEKMLFSEDAALRGTHIRNSLPLYETLMTMPAPIKEWIDGKNPTTIDQDLTAARNDEGLTTEHKVKDPGTPLFCSFGASLMKNCRSGYE